jgi:hypothetical protein
MISKRQIKGGEEKKSWEKEKMQGKAGRKGEVEEEEVNVINYGTIFG